MISVLTPSFNKSEYILDAIKSILAQSYQDWEYLIIENSTDDITRKIIRGFLQTVNDSRIIYKEVDFSPEERKTFYVTTRIINTFYPQMKGDIIFFLSDDDIIYPNCFEVCSGYFNQHQDRDFIYFSQETYDMWEQERRSAEIRARNIRGAGHGLDFDCAVDGGQVMHRKSCLDKITFPYFDESLANASHCDGLFLNKLGRVFPCYPIDQFLGRHRRTKKSTWVSL